MSTLSPAQVAAYALAAGFTGPRAVWATAVALAESGGRTHATGVNSDAYRSRDRGLWQINSHWHPEVTNAQAYDPATAARAAYTISHGGKDWSAWSTYGNGTAAANLGRAQVAVAQAKAAGYGSRKGQKGPRSGVQTVGIHLPPLGPFGPFNGVPLPGGPLGPLGGLTQGGGNPLSNLGGNLATSGKALGSLAVLGVHAGQWMSDPHNWLRVALVAGGSIGVLVALYLLADSGAVGSTAQNAAGTTKKAATDALAAAAL